MCCDPIASARPNMGIIGSSGKPLEYEPRTPGRLGNALSIRHRRDAAPPRNLLENRIDGPDYRSILPKTLASGATPCGSQLEWWAVRDRWGCVWPSGLASTAQMALRSIDRQPSYAPNVAILLYVKGRVKPASAGRVRPATWPITQPVVSCPKRPRGKAEGHSGQETVRGLCGGF